MTINLTIAKRPLKDGTCHIIYDLINGRERRKKIPTNIRCELNYWDSKKQRVKPTHVTAKILNNKLDELGDKVRVATDKFYTGQYSFAEVVSFLEGKTAFGSVDEYIETEIRNSRSKPTYIDYKTAINSLKKHTGIKDKLLFHQVNYGLLDKFKQQTLRNGMKATAFNSYLTKIRAVMNDAYNKGFIYDKFELNRGLKLPERRKQLKTCTSTEFEQAIAKINTIYDWQALGFYLLMFCTRGMYPADIVNFRMANFENVDDIDKFCDADAKYLVHRRSKTSSRGNDDMIIRIDEKPTLQLITILKRSIVLTHYHKKPEIIPSILDDIRIFNYDMDLHYTQHNNVWDYYKKRVSKLLGYSYNTARKTFNTYALELQVSDTIRRVLLGHTDSSMLSHYDDLNAKRFMKQVEVAHMSVLEDFRALELMELLLTKLGSLDVPEWLYNGTIYHEEDAFWDDYKASINI
jgi:hypothetical protein